MATRYATPTTNKRPTVKDRSAVAEKRAADLAQRDEDDLRAWQMVRAGASYREVATAMGVSNPGASYRMVQRALLAMPEANRATVKRLLSDQVDDLYREIRPLAAGRVRRVDTRGRSVSDADGQPVYDEVSHHDRVQATRVAVQLLARKAHLWGADAPEIKVIEISVVTDEALADDQRSIEDELAALGVDISGVPSVEDIAGAIDVRSTVKAVLPELTS
jgi:hypothetical protein